MLKKTALAILAGTALAGASAQTVTNIQADSRSGAYLQDSRGVIVRSQSGLCWRTGSWTAADAVTGCDGALVPPIAKPTAPAIVAPVVAAAPTPLPPKPCDFSVELSSDEAFGFNKTVLNRAAKARLDAEVLPKLAACEKIDSLVITGHADRIGSQQYNRKLSERRASAVAIYLQRKGVSTRVDTVGAGQSAPITSCPGKLQRAKLIECLAPNRRVVIEAKGTAK